MLLVQLSDPHIVEEGELLARPASTPPRSSARPIEHVNRLDPQPDLVLLTGDLVNEGRPAQYEHLREAARRRCGRRSTSCPATTTSPTTLREAFPDCTCTASRAAAPTA